MIAQHAIKHGYDQIICAFNATRHDINKAYRFAMRRRGLLDVGDRIVCRFNHRRQSIFNGMQFVVTEILGEDDISYTADLRIDLGGGELGQPRRSVKIQKISLGNPNYVGSDRVEGCVEFDYSYAITAHLSQGSQWAAFSGLSEQSTMEHGEMGIHGTDAGGAEVGGGSVIKTEMHRYTFPQH